MYQLDTPTNETMDNSAFNGTKLDRFAFILGNHNFTDLLVITSFIKYRDVKYN